MQDVSFTKAMLYMAEFFASGGFSEKEYILGTCIQLLLRCSTSAHRVRLTIVIDCTYATVFTRDLMHTTHIHLVSPTDIFLDLVGLFLGLVLFATLIGFITEVVENKMVAISEGPCFSCVSTLLELYS